MKIKYERKEMEDFVIKFTQKVIESNEAGKNAMESVVDYMKTNNEDSKQKAKELLIKCLDITCNLCEDNREREMLVDFLEEIGVTENYY